MLFNYPGLDFGDFVLWPLYGGLGQPVSWLVALPSVALCLLWLQIDVATGRRVQHRLDLRLPPCLYLAAGLLGAPLATLLGVAAYAVGLAAPTAIAQTYWKRRYERRVAAEAAQRRELSERIDRGETDLAQVQYTRLADENEAAGRLVEALAALQQLQVYQWNDRALNARIERLRRRIEQQRR